MLWIIERVTAADSRIEMVCNSWNSKVVLKTSPVMKNNATAECTLRNVAPASACFCLLSLKWQSTTFLAFFFFFKVNNYCFYLRIFSSSLASLCLLLCCFCCHWDWCSCDVGDVKGFTTVKAVGEHELKRNIKDCRSTQSQHCVWRASSKPHRGVVDGQMFSSFISVKRVDL